MRSFEQQQDIDLALSQGESLPASVLASQSLPAIITHAATQDRGIVDYDSFASLFSYSYEDLLQDASCILTGLRQQGLKPKAKVILQLESSRYFFACLWACWLGGFVATPLGKDLTGDRLKGILQLCQQPKIIIDENLPELLNNPQNNDYHHGKLDDLALLLFTSGSTGQPKGVMLSVRNLLASVYGMAKVNGLTQQDITLNWMPLEHVASLVMFHLTEVYLGCGQIQVKSEVILQNPLQWLNLIDKHRVTATWSPNFAYNLVNEQLVKIEEHHWDLSCLRWMGNGAEAVVGKTTQKFLELLAPYGLQPTVVSPGYGMTETTSGICHSNDFYLNLNRDLVSVGAPIPGVSLRIVNEENGLLPAGAVGLLQVKGETVTRGYYGQPELNESVFTPDGWFNTGDLGFIEQGRLTITGRQKDVIIINGVNYYNQEIETVVEGIAGVNLSFTAACGVKDEQQQEQVAIFFSTDKKDDALRQLINQIRQRVFKEIGVTPAYIIPVNPDTIPKTPIGKIIRSQLSQRFNQGEFERLVTQVAELSNQRDLSHQELPGNDIEQQLVAIWQEVLKLEKVGVRDNFFELGGNSLLLMQVLSKLTPTYQLSAVDLFQYPTIATLANYLSNEGQAIALQQGKRRGELRRSRNKDVAVIGLACRFPGANNLEEFWQNLCHGVESISWFGDEEITNSGVEAELVSNPNYVKASPILEDIEGFDADFWGFTPKEAQLLDPQQRLFLECAWESLEDAGYDPFTYQGAISLYGGAATNTYLLNNIYPNRHNIDDRDNLQTINLSSLGGFQVSTANDKDYLTTRTSYKLNLKGSSVNVQTACSTSLVAVHLACQSLINSECDLALAGGVSVHSPQKMGYLYQEGMILSTDGHCRAFDASASGTIFGSGAGIVVLKLLERAVAEGDRIYGVIKGSAVNNDGGTKVGYFAPNVDGQARVIAEALAVADIAGDTIGYVEAHGTGTKLGDPIEIAALSQVYHDDTRKRGYCALGSVKTNVGHLQMASGIVGLIKTVLCLQRQKIPPSLHFRDPNPQIDFAHSPFYINTQLQDWQTGNYPRRAGVNSLGIGGTNAHVVLEEFITQEVESDRSLPAYLLTLSAKNDLALGELGERYREHIVGVFCAMRSESFREMPLRDICFTSNIGRHHFPRRCAIVAQDQQDLIAQLNKISAGNLIPNPKIAFLFTGQGSQYKGMAQQLYDTCTVFRENCDRCWEIFVGAFRAMRSKSFRETPPQGFNQVIHQPQYSQPLLFIIEYSLAQLWISWGIQPDVLLGHSIGEYVAACLAGVFSLEDGLKLVSARGKLMASLPDNGAMIAVFEDVQGVIDSQGNLALAADNGSHVVLSGLKTEINDLILQLDQRQIKYKLLDVDRGFHSPLMQPIVEEFKAVAQTVNYHLPTIPLVADTTGKLATENIATADYWIEHILQPIQFATGINYLADQGVNIFLEIGTKPILTGIVKSLLEDKLVLPSLGQQQGDWQQILTCLGELYTAGLDINWLSVTQDYQGKKISLPIYPFQRQRYWFDLPQELPAVTYKSKDTIHSLLGKPLASPLKHKIFQSGFNFNNHPWLRDHCLAEKIIFPGAGYIEIAIALGIFHYQNPRLLIEDLTIIAPLYFDQEKEIQIITSPESNSWQWEIYSLGQDQDWDLHCTGQVSSLDNSIAGNSLAEIQANLYQTELDVEQYYLTCQQKGINYGKSFQGIKQLWAKDNQALGLIKLPANLNNQKYHCHPALLDACCQILFAALPTKLQTNTYIPVGVEKLSLTSLPSNQVWSYLKLTATNNPQTLTADVWLYNQEGELIAQLQGLKSQAITSQPTWYNWLYQPQWQPQPLSTTTPLVANDRWLIFADSKGAGERLATKLNSQNQQYHLVTREELPNNPQAFIELMQQHSKVTGVIYLWSLEERENNLECQSYLYLIQAIIKLSLHPRLYFVTHYAQPVTDYQPLSGINNACLWGMDKAIAQEYPELCCVGIDLDGNNKIDHIYQEICGNNQEQVAYRHGQRYVSRLVRYQNQLPQPKQQNLQLQINQPGNLDSLQWQEVNRPIPQDHQITIEVQATGLNFRDVMSALDLYPDNTKFLGLECAGIVTAVGSKVNNYQVGDEVIAISHNSFSQYLAVDSLLTIPKPPSLSFTAAATIPVTFLTAYYTLVHLAQLQPGEKILIHSAAGGVGLAAIQIAQQIGAEIYATASPSKWALLQSMGVSNIMNSRNLDFAQKIISATNNEGVDVVLNSLTGEFISQSMAVIKEQGRFIEIGKLGIWSLEAVQQSKPTLNYFIVDLWQITQDNPQLIQQMLCQLIEEFAVNKLTPLPHTTFKSDRVTDAFRYMQQGKHQGKIIITPPPQQFTGTYLIAGGMGAIGLQVAQWLITKGVKNIVLVGRNGIKPQDQDILQKLPDNTQVNCIKADIANTNQLTKVLEQIKLTLPPLKGIIHCAGITSDRPIINQDWSSFESVLAPKVQGAWNLHQLTLKYDLENFIMFSSAASLIGSAGQVNYCAANAFLDVLAHARRSQGLRAIAINWTAWQNTGLAAKPEITNNLNQKGIGAIKPQAAIDILEQLLSNSPIQIGVIPINWQQWQRHHVVTNFDKYLIEATSFSENQNPDYQQQLIEATDEQRLSIIITQISQELANILGIKNLNNLDLDLGFSELGLDSLGSVELKNKLQDRYELKLSPTVIFDYPNLITLGKYLLSLLFKKSLSQLTTNNISDPNVTKIKKISETEAEALLLKELQDLDF